MFRLANNIKILQGLKTLRTPMRASLSPAALSDNRWRGCGGRSSRSLRRRSAHQGIRAAHVGALRVLIELAEDGVVIAQIQAGTTTGGGEGEDLSRYSLIYSFIPSTYSSKCHQFQVFSTNKVYGDQNILYDRK